MSNRQTSACDLLFNDGKNPAKHDEFIGRHDLRQIFTDYAWGIKTARDYVFIIEGPSGFGKTSFAEWCLGEVENNPQRGGVILTFIHNWEETGLTSPEGFYQHLSDKFRQTVQQNVFLKSKQKNTFGGKINRAIWHARNLGWWLKRRINIKELGLFGVKVAVQYHGSPPNSSRFFEFIENLHAQTKNHLEVKSYIFIFDDFAIEDAKIFKNILDLLMNIKKHRLEWSNDIPNVMLIILTPPGVFRGDYEYGLQTLSSAGVSKRVLKREQLKPFSESEVNDYIVRRNAQAKIKIEESDFIDALYFMSGGIPRLTNHLGLLACQIWKKNGSASLSSKHIFEAITHTETKDEFAETVRQVVKDAYGFNAERFLTSESDISVYHSFYAAYKINYNKVDYKDSFIKGWTKDKWKTEILNKVGNSTAANRESFEKIWNELDDKKILVGVNSRYKFCAEAVRRYCSNIKPK